MFIGLAMFHYVLPIPLTLIELKPVTYNMQVPIHTFTHHLLFVSILVLTHKIYTSLTRKKGHNFFRTILKKTSFYKSLSPKEIMLISCISLLSTFYIFFVFGQWQRDTSERTPILYLANFLSKYIWLPIILLFPDVYSSIGLKKSSKKLRTTILLYSTILFVITVASNNRSIMFSGILMVASIYLVGLFFNYYKINDLIKSKKIIFVIVAIVLFTGPLVNFGYAMVIVRKFRTNLEATELLKETVKVYQNKDLISQFKDDKSNNKDTHYAFVEWDETYIDNIIINRFVNLKISDNCLFYAKEMGYQNPEMIQLFKYQLIGTLPNLILKIFNIEAALKAKGTEGSIGDMLYSVAIHNDSSVGSAVISAMPGVGMAIFGYWYFLITIPIFLIIFLMFDSFALVGKKVHFSIYFYVMIVVVFNYFNDRHVFISEIKFILRSFPEGIISYLLVRKGIKYSFNILKK
jgi:hypothetical protein